MPVKVGINGFGRIGRITFRYMWDMPELEIVHVNELVGGAETAAYLAQFDSVHGPWRGKTCEAQGEKCFTVNGTKVGFSEEEDFTKVDWAGAGVELVIACDGVFLTTEALKPYLEVCGVKRVVVSAPVKEPSVLNVVVGVNEDKLNDSHVICTAASCTTNCIAPVIKVMHEKLGIVSGMITTVHNITGTQSLVDMPNQKKKDLRRSRSGMLNLAPTSTGSATAVRFHSRPSPQLPRSRTTATCAQLQPSHSSALCHAADPIRSDLPCHRRSPRSSRSSRGSSTAMPSACPCSTHRSPTSFSTSAARRPRRRCALQRAFTARLHSGSLAPQRSLTHSGAPTPPRVRR